MFKTIIRTRAGDMILHEHETLIAACEDADWWESDGHEAHVTQHYLNSFTSNLIS